MSVPVRNEHAHQLIEKFFYIEKHEQIEWRLNSKVESDEAWDESCNTFEKYIILSKVKFLHEVFVERVEYICR